MLIRKIMGIVIVLALSIGTLGACSQTTATTTGTTSADDTVADVTSAIETTTANNEKKITVGFANMADSIEFCMNVKVGLEKECKAKGWDIISLDNNLDGQKAVQNTDMLIQQKVDFVVMFNIDASTQPAVADKLTAAGIPAIAIDIYMPDFPFFGVDNAKAGSLGGEWLGNYAKSTWNQEPDLFVIMDNPTGGKYAKDRCDALEAGLLKVYPDYPKEKIVRVDAKSDVSTAQEAMTNVLTANPTAKNIVVSGINDQVCAGALAALETTKRDADAVVCSLGCDSSFLKQLQATKGEGAWKASIAFAPEKYGEQIVPLIEKVLVGGEKLSDVSTVENFTVTKDTIAQYYPDYQF